MKSHSRSVFLISVLQAMSGMILTAAAFGLIIIPQGFAAGGITGLCRILCRIIPLPLSLLVLFVSLVLLILGWLIVGRAFAAKTAAVSVILPLLLELFSRRPLVSLEQDPLLSSILAGITLGIGTHLILQSGASSGGFDVLAVILNRRFPIPVSAVLRFCDCAVILIQAARQPLPQTIHGILVFTISSTVVGYLSSANIRKIKLMIFSDQDAKIREALLEKTDAEITSLEAESGLQEKPMKVIVSVIPCQKVSTM